MFDQTELDNLRAGVIRTLRSRFRSGRLFSGSTSNLVSEIQQAAADRAAERVARQRFHDYFRNQVPNSSHLTPQAPSRLPL